jgi:CRISPR-associated protein Cas2
MSRDAARRYLVAYDVPDDRRRVRIAKKLGSYGDRVQFSVFIVDVRPARLVRLRSELERLMYMDEDSVLICEIGLVLGVGRGRFEILGRSRPLTDDAAFIL